MVSIGDLAARALTALADGDLLPLGRHSVRWFDRLRLPHAWECGVLLEEETRILFCGDLFTQGGANLPPITKADILEPSKAISVRKVTSWLVFSPVCCVAQRVT
jgi:hypothetical protein